MGGSGVVVVVHPVINNETDNIGFKIFIVISFFFE